MMLEKMVAWEEALVQEQHHRRLREEASRRHRLGLVPRRERVSLQPVLARVGSGW